MPYTNPVVERSRIFSAEGSLLEHPRLKVIDDFNGAELKNRFGMHWLTEPERSEKIKMSISEEDSRSSTRGHALNIHYDLAAKEQVTVKSGLGSLDVSQAEAVAFRCHHEISGGGKGFSGRIRMSLKDQPGQSVLYDMTSLCPEGKEWKDVIIALSGFGKLDSNRLSDISWAIVAGQEPIQGNLQLDEITFYGKEDLDFESRHDNVKSFPVKTVNAEGKFRLSRELSDVVFLKEIARDTWKYFENARDVASELIVDHIRVGDTPLIADYTSPTNIAMDFMGTIAAYDLGFISRDTAVQRTREVIETLKKLKKWKGFFYNFYNTTTLAVTRPFVSSVDCGWLAISLVVVRQAFPNEFGKEASAILDEMNFDVFLDPENNQLSIGYDEEKDQVVGYHYGLLATEARATSFYAIGKGDLPKSHWWFIYRTPPSVWKWQTQPPKGLQVVQDGVDYIQGYYEYRGKKFVPSWGGSLFEFLMPTIVINERKLAPKGLGLNNRVAAELHRDYALKEKGYKLWGLSPAAVSNGRQWRYIEMGIKALGVKGYQDSGYVTPHVSFLALNSLPEDAIKNIRKFLNYGSYGEYGFYDTISVEDGSVNPQYLALDQGMTLVAICNYLKNGSIQELFHRDKVAQNAEDLLIKESFFNP